MRRGVLAVIGTIAGTGLLVGAKLGTSAMGGANAVALTDAGATPTANMSSAPPSPSGHATTGKKTTTTTTTTTGLKDGTFTGAGAAEKYGTVVVTVTVANGKISNLSQTYSGQSGESQQISGAAFPQLKQEALSAQSAKIATVSGATYTSGAYRVSLQSALDKAKA